MPHPFERGPARLRPIAAVLAALLLACEEPGPMRVTGTSTSVGTTIGGTALLSDGKPAAGAKVTARSQEIAFTGGRPESPILAETKADSGGHFALHGIRDGNFALEIACETDAGCASAGNGEGFFDRVYGATSARPLPAARLAAPGSLHGILSEDGSPPDSALWIGIAGTAHFATARKNAAGAWEFLLADLFPADYILTVVAHPDTGADSTAQKVGGVSVRSGTVTEIRLGL